MPALPSNLFWDSCIYCAYLYGQDDKYDVPSIERYLRDAKGGRYVIHSSSIIYAEVMRSKIKHPQTGSLDELCEDLGGAFVLTDPAVNVQRLAGQLRDIPYRKGESAERRLSTPDAIILATCLHLRDDLGVPIDILHTYDNGKRRPKAVPILRYEEWCEGLAGEHLNLAHRVISLKRQIPTHPEPELFTP